MTIQHERGHKQVVCMNDSGYFGARQCHIVPVQIVHQCRIWRFAHPVFETVRVHAREHKDGADICAVKHGFTIVAA